MREIEKLRKMHVREAMKTEFPHVKKDDPIEKALDLLDQRGVRMVPVLGKGNKFIGEIVERDMLKVVINPQHLPAEVILLDPLLGLGYYPKKAGDLMRTHDLYLEPKDTVEFAAKMMFDHDITVMPVLDKGKLVGIISEDDILDRIRK